MQNIFNILTSSSCCSSTGEEPGERGEGGGGRRAGEEARRGGFQSDRPTEKSDNERSGLSGVQTPFLREIAAREGEGT